MSATKSKTSTTKTKAGPVVTTTVSLTTETLTLTKERRQKLESQFLETLHAKSTKVHALLDYATYTRDQIVAAMYASADATGDTIVVTPAAASTMKRSLSVAKAWVALKAATLVEDEAVDDVFQLLSQIADISPTGLSKYALVDANGKPAGYGVVTVQLRAAKGKPEPEPFEVHPSHGTGEGAIAGILEQYLAERIRGTAADAIDWLRRYKDAVVYANNEKRRAGASHDVIAADARKGAGQGENVKESAGKKERGARGSYNKGKKGTKGNGKSPAVVTPTEPVKEAAKAKPAKPQTTAQKVATLSTKDLIVALTKRVVDYTAPITIEEDKLINLLHEYYEARFLKGIPVGGTIHDVKVKGKKRTVKMPAPVVVTGPATGTTLKPWSSQSTPEAALARGEVLSTAHMNKLLLTEQAKGTITAEKRKRWMQEAFDGTMNNASFRTRLAKLQGRKILTAVAS